MVNILLDKYFQIKIIDFSVAKIYNARTDNNMTEKCGTECFSSPE